MAVSNVNNTSSASTQGANLSATMDTNASQDRFLKLLVAQLVNQDPMNPMDNAQMTSQIAQINTVTGIQQLNNTMMTMAGQFASMQVLQGTSLVGREVLVEGDKLAVDEGTTIAKGNFDLLDSATNVKVDIYSTGGLLLGSVPMGPRAEGRQSFEFDAGSYVGGMRYVVSAVNAKDKVDVVSLSRDKVVSAGAQNGVLSLTLQKGGAVGYPDIKAIL
jgi:flagellar basal-body rod modification protein FlgD